jgi:hypothetical protein
MTPVLGIDPGPTESAYCLIDERQRVIAAGKEAVEKIIGGLRTSPPAHVVIESIQSYGMPVGRSTFETCYVIGELIRACKDAGIPYTLIPRPEYTRRICGVGKINDAILRQALLLRFGGDKKGEPLEKLKGCTDKRSAFAVAAYYVDLTGGVHA